MGVKILKVRGVMKKLVVVIVALFSIAMMEQQCFAHGGGLDRQGGHFVRTPGHGRIVGTYHFHR